MLLLLGCILSVPAKGRRGRCLFSCRCYGPDLFLLPTVEYTECPCTICTVCCTSRAQSRAHTPALVHTWPVTLFELKICGKKLSVCIYGELCKRWQTKEGTFSRDDVCSQTLETLLSLQEQIWLTFNYWTTWRSTTWWTRTFEGLRGARMFHLVSLSLQISPDCLPGSRLGLCVWVVFVVCLVGLVVGFFPWGNLFSISGSLQLLTDQVSH